MHKIAETQHFGATDNPNNCCAILCQHSDDGRTFLNEYSQIEKRCSASRVAIRKYIDLEKDSGSAELAREIAKTIMVETDGNFHVVIIKSNVPRAIIDTNRSTMYAITNLLGFSKKDKLLRELKQLHFNIIQLIRQQLFDLLMDGGVFVDVHTMAPFSLKVKKQLVTNRSRLTKKFISRYLDAYINGHKTGVRRYFDVATGFPDWEIADEDIIENLEERLEEADMDYRLNDPYPAVIHGLVGQLMLDYPGISIDVPKDYLTVAKAGDKDFDLFNPKIDEEQLIKVASPIALAVLDRQRDLQDS